MKILLTGATGFIGSRALMSLKETNDVRALPSALARGDLTLRRAEELYAFTADFAPEGILHTAAISDMGYAQQHPDESYQANVMLPEALARISSRLGCKLVSCSSDQVYNGCAGDGPFDEHTPCAPQNTYGCHKLEAEARVAAADPTAVSLRLTWMYDLPAYGLFTHKNLLTMLLSSAMRGQSLRLSDTDMRGITYARQVVDNLPLCFDLEGGAYNYGSESDQSVFAIASAWKQALGLSLDLTAATDGAPRSLRMDCRRAKAAGIQFDDSADSILRCIEDYGLQRQ